jgi:membrane protease YdiL (CAAX protease family)
LPHGAFTDIFTHVEHEPERDEPEFEFYEPPPDIFDRVNNYLLLVYAAACFLMYVSVIGMLVIGERYILSLSIPGIVAFIGPLYLLSRRFSLSFTDAYRLALPDPLATVCVLLIAAGSIIPVEALSSVIERRWPPDADYISFIIAIKPKGIGSFIAVALGLAVVTPLGEELLFRGFIQRILARNMNGRLAVLLAALLFAIVHFELAVIPAIAVLGIIFGYIFYRTGNLFYPILAHGLYNLVSLVRLHITPIEDLEAGGYEPLPVTWAAVSVLLLLLGFLMLERIHAKSNSR